MFDITPEQSIGFNGDLVTVECPPLTKQAGFLSAYTDIFFLLIGAER